MSKPSLGIFTAIKQAKINFSKLPGEAKTSYYIGGALFLIILIFLIKFVVPEKEQDLVLPNQGAKQSKRLGKNDANPNAVIPNTLAEEIINNRKQIQNKSQVVFNRFEESKTKLTDKKNEFLESLEIDLTPLDTNEPEEKIVLNEEVNVEQSGIEESPEGNNEPVNQFLGQVVGDSGQRNNAVSNINDVVKALMTDPEIAQVWANGVKKQDSTVLKSGNAQVVMGNTVVFAAPNKAESDIEQVMYQEENQKDEPQEYSGDDFQPGRVILARIDGLVESDKQTPFVRLRPVEGPKEWVEDAIFLAQPNLIEGQGFLIEVKSVTHKNQSGSFDGVVVTPDDSRNAIIVDDIDSREFERLGYLVGGGFLSGLNILANRIGTTVSNQNGSISNVEANKETLAISALGGVGQRGEDYLFSKISQTPDNYILEKNRLVGIMVVAKPDMKWLPDLENKSVY